jgi:hypothetical protein
MVKVALPISQIAYRPNSSTTLYTYLLLVVAFTNVYPAGNDLITVVPVAALGPALVAVKVK